MSDCDPDINYDELDLIGTSSPSGRSIFTIKTKRSIVKCVQDLLASDPSLSQAAACRILKVPPNYYVRFKKTLEKIKQIESAATLVPVHITGDRVKLHPGKQSSITNLEGQLTTRILQLRDSGFQVSSK